MDQLRNIFKERLRLTLDLSGLRQEDLAREVEATPSTVQRWIQGERWPQSDRVCEIATTLAVSPQWLMGAEVTEKPSPEIIISELQKLLGLNDKSRFPAHIPIDLLEMLEKSPVDTDFEAVKLALKAVIKKATKDKESESA